MVVEPDARPLLILGTRTLAVEIADVASEIPGFQVAGFVENMDRSRCAETLEDQPIIWVDELSKYSRSCSAIGGLATTHRSIFIDQVARFGIPFATLVHPFSRISGTSLLGEGTFISTGVIIAAHTRLGNHIMVNRGALIGHHTTIGDYVTIQPGANIAGICRIGSRTYIGMGSVILDNITIGSSSIIAAGSVVTKDVPDHVQVMGVPARIVKENIQGR